MYFFEKEKLKDQQGVVLLMSLMILLVMTVSVIALSRVIIGEVKMTRNSDNAIVAFYVTESGMEEALYYLKYSKISGDFTNYFDQLDDGYSVVIDDERGFINTLSTTTASYFESFDIATSSPVRTEISLPGADIPSAATNLPTDYKLDWTIDDCYQGGHASDRLEISYTSLYKSGSTLKSNTKQTFTTCGCSNGVDTCDTHVSADLDNNKFYYFTFRPLDSDVSYLKFTPTKDGDDYLPGYATVKVSGHYRQSIYHITAGLPVYAPTSNVFNYIIFSEQDLEKGF
ncbi:pilus assembly PilX N-terminal domain-containing protein [Candidatus Nomurabacteria bacterium]|nr:pilus assembly PilX N-terminal domain-containing protein [Candidatus Nomurabacteria bacterium]